jgi:hypothetical protein
MTPRAGPPRAVGRRDFLRKATAVGTGAFAVPMIATVDPADAQPLTSPPPEPPRSAEPEAPRTSFPAPPGGRRELRRRASTRTELPRTGADIDRLVAAGLAATAGGAALVLWSADPRPTPKSPRPSPRRPADEEPAT